MVWIPRTYARAAGFQSEIGRRVITRIAFGEIECRRLMRVEEYNIKHSIKQIENVQQKLRQTVSSYKAKLRQYKLDRRKRYYDNTKLLETNDSLAEAKADENKEEITPLTATTYSVSLSRESSSSLISETGEKSVISDNSVGSLYIKNDDFEKTDNKTISGDCHTLDAYSGTAKLIDMKVSRDKSSIAETDIILSPRKRNRRKKVSQLDLIKLQYSNNTKKLFNAVHALAEVHGIQIPEKKSPEIPDPREQAQLQQSKLSLSIRTSGNSLDTNASLPSSYLFNMQHGYEWDECEVSDTDHANASCEDIRHSTAKSDMKLTDASSTVATDMHYKTWKNGLIADLNDRQISHLHGQIPTRYNYSRKIAGINERNNIWFRSKDIVGKPMVKPILPEVNDHGTFRVPLFNNLKEVGTRSSATQERIKRGTMRQSRDKINQLNSRVDLTKSNTTMPDDQLRLPVITEQNHLRRSSFFDNDNTNKALSPIKNNMDGKRILWQSALSKLKNLHFLK